MTPYVTFEAEEHVYTLHQVGKPNRVLPSVTQIIQDNRLGFNFNVLPAIDLAWYGDRGTKVHLACDYLDKNNLDWDILAPELFGYVESYQLGKHEIDFEILRSEMLVFDRLHRFAGQLDRIVKFGSKWKRQEEVAQIDLKAGAPHISHGYQTAGYNSCLDGITPEYNRHIRRYCLYLNGDGSLPKLVSYPDLNDFTIFESAVNLTYARRI